MDMGGLDPFAAAARRAVDAVFGGVFLIFAVPGLFEFQIEEAIDVFEGDVVVRAALRGHVLGVSDGEGEDAAEAGVAHAVLAGEFCGAGGRDVGEAG